jgi:hypothetical protein
MNGNRVHLPLLVFVAILLGSISACGGGEQPAIAAAPEERSAAAVQATEDLARRLGLAADEISLVREDAVTWSDGSLGCPRKGMMYTQALVPGVLIVLEAGGRRFEYHAAADREPFLCENPRPPAAVRGNE